MNTLSLNLAHTAPIKTNTNKSRLAAAESEAFSFALIFTQFHLTEKKPFDPELCTGKAEAFFQLGTTFENTTQMKGIKSFLAWRFSFKTSAETLKPIGKRV